MVLMAWCGSSSRVLHLLFVCRMHIVFLNVMFGSRQKTSIAEVESEVVYSHDGCMYEYIYIYIYIYVSCVRVFNLKTVNRGVCEFHTQFQECVGIVITVITICGDCVLGTESSEVKSLMLPRLPAVSFSRPMPLLLCNREQITCQAMTPESHT